MRRSFLPAAGFVLSIVVALRGQQLLYQPDQGQQGAILMYGAMVILLATLSFWPPQAGGRSEEWEPAPAGREMRPMVPWPALRLGLMALMALGAVLAYAWFAGNTFTRRGVVAWLVALAAWLLAVAEMPASAPGSWRRRLAAWQENGGWQLRLQWHHLAIALVLLLGVTFRVHRLDQVPSDLGSDQAEKLLDVFDVLNGQRPIFFPRNTGREAFQFYATALLIRFTPLEISHLALKVGTVLISLVALPFTYLLGRELYDRRLGLLAMLFLSFSHWHVAISRVGLRFPFTAAFAAPTLYFLLRAFRRNRRNDWLAAGIFLGVGLHTYIPMRIVPFLLLALSLAKLALDWLQARAGQADGPEATALQMPFWLNALLSAFTTLLLFLPLGRYMIDQPQMFWYRVTTRSSDALANHGWGELWRLFWGNVKNAALMFNVRGDAVFANTVPFSPVLGWVTGSLFVLGVTYLAWRLYRTGDRRVVYLGLMLFFLLLPSILSLAFPRENPSVVRAGGAVVVTSIIAALPLWVLWQRLGRLHPRLGPLAAGILTLWLLLLAVPYNYHWYFVRYDQQFRQTIWNAREMAAAVRGFASSGGDLAHAYHVPYPYWVDTRAIAIDAGDITWRNALGDLEAALPAQQQDPAAKLYLLNVQDGAAVARLQQAFPSGHLTRVASVEGPGKDFLLYYVPASP